MPGLDPGIPRWRLDCRVKPGNDDLGGLSEVFSGTGARLRSIYVVIPLVPFDEAGESFLDRRPRLEAEITS